jgi:hypothetical protein
MNKVELIDFLEWAEHEGFIQYFESMKIEMVEQYLKSK